ncbi:hypothetical protein A9995_07865 [Erythrobacter sp. QSSC1-22B]|nr:hypothetical protein A9995_07865 [Erythrobacter sp. QSSC1-22B]
MAQMMRELDQSSTALGSPVKWAASLQSVVSLMVNSRFPMFVAWGEELSLLYNDAYAAILGEKHPRALGRPFEEVWNEIWDDLTPLVESALQGRASWLEDLPLTMNRHGYDEATWFTFSYSPVRGESGEICGLFCACTETTEKVLAIRSIKAERARLENLFEQAPGFMAMLSEPEHTFEFVNKAYQRLIGDRPVIGLTIREALPELVDQGFYELLDTVYQSGQPYIGRQQPVRLQRTTDGPIEQAYVDFIYQPVKDADGKVTGIFAEGYDVTEQRTVEARLESHARTLAILNRTGTELSSELDLDKVVRHVTDAGVALTGAQVGAFFYNTKDAEGEKLTLYHLSGAERSQFDKFGPPRETDVFNPDAESSGLVRSADITSDPRYGNTDPPFGIPEHDLPVRSYLSVPVKSRSGEVIGELFFGHEEPAMFSEAHEELILGIASQAASAFDNAQLYREAEMEIAQRKKFEARQVLLINELNHRVKNTLAIVQGLAQQSFKTDLPTEDAKASFGARLNALAAAHSLLTRQNWEAALLSETIHDAVTAAAGETASRIVAEGPDVVLPPQTAVTWAMAIHELCTNAIKYGALSNESGTVTVRWSIAETKGRSHLHLEWTEAGGPAVTAPPKRGFGSRMIERALASELQGDVTLNYEPSGVRCVIDAPLPQPK